MALPTLLSGVLINADATLNNFVPNPEGAIAFIPSSIVQFALQLIDTSKGIRYVPPSTAVITFTFNNADFTSFAQPAAFIDPLDRSLISLSLTPTQTSNMIGGNLTFVVDVLGDGTQLINGILYNGLSYVDTTI